jgi:hypothetical protein
MRSHPGLGRNAERIRMPATTERVGALIATSVRRSSTRTAGAAGGRRDARMVRAVRGLRATTTSRVFEGAAASAKASIVPAAVISMTFLAFMVFDM